MACDYLKTYFIDGIWHSQWLCILIITNTKLTLKVVRIDYPEEKSTQM